MGRVHGPQGSEGHARMQMGGSAVPETGLLPVPLTGGIQTHTPSPCEAMPECKWGGGGTRPRYLIVCLWRRLLASRHCSF